MKEIKCTFHSDAGHGWLAVKIKTVEELELLDSVSGYSYVRGKTIYLEEDRDAGLFIMKCKELGITYKIKEGKWVNYSPIRSYERFQNDKEM